MPAPARDLSTNLSGFGSKDILATFQDQKQTLPSKPVETRYRLGPRVIGLKCTMDITPGRVEQEGRWKRKVGGRGRRGIRRRGIRRKRWNKDKEVE